MIGNKIKDYTILSKLGEGAFGRVYLVKSIHNQQYALKIISITPDIKNYAQN